MKKGLLISIAVISLSLLGVLSLNAARNQLKIVSENDSAKQLSDDGAYILNTINANTSRLSEGLVDIEIIISNSKKTEIMYAIDNGSSMSANKSALIDAIKSNAQTLESMDNISQGVASSTTDNRTLVKPDSSNIGMQLDNVKSLESDSKEGEIFNIMSDAVSAFSETAENKILIVFVSNIGSLDSSSIAALKSTISSYTASGIKLYVYAVGMTNTTDLNNIFTSNVPKSLNDSLISSLNFKPEVIANLPSVKEAVGVRVSYDNYILNNFEIRNIQTTFGSAAYDNASNEVRWTVENIPANSVIKLTYTLALKDTVDQSIVDSINLRTNRQIIVTESGQTIGTYPSNELIEDQICSPTIRILNAGVIQENPKTGVANYIIAGSCMLAVALITLVVLNNKNQFDRI